MEHLLHITPNYGWFWGRFFNNQSHRHYALQISIPIDESITIETKDQNLRTSHPVLLPSNVTHKIHSTGQHLLILIHPLSPVGHSWHNLTEESINEIKSGPVKNLQQVLRLNKEIIQPTLLLQIVEQTLTDYECICKQQVHQGDPRINKVLTHLQANYHQTTSAAEMAEYCHLSTSRFLHRFREQTGLTFRRAQLWTKLLKALSLIKTHQLTQAAHEAGFADSAHFSRTFRENFGFSPMELLKISQFIQV